MFSFNHEPINNEGPLFDLLNELMIKKSDSESSSATTDSTSGLKLTNEIIEQFLDDFSIQTRFIPHPFASSAIKSQFLNLLFDHLKNNNNNIFHSDDDNADDDQQKSTTAAADELNGALNVLRLLLREVEGLDQSVVLTIEMIEFISKLLMKCFKIGRKMDKQFESIRNCAFKCLLNLIHHSTDLRNWLCKNEEFSLPLIVESIFDKENFEEYFLFTRLLFYMTFEKQNAKFFIGEHLNQFLLVIEKASHQLSSSFIENHLNKYSKIYSEDPDSDFLLLSSSSSSSAFLNNNNNINLNNNNIEDRNGDDDDEQVSKKDLVVVEEIYSQVVERESSSVFNTQAFEFPPFFLSFIEDLFKTGYCLSVHLDSEEQLQEVSNCFKPLVQTIIHLFTSLSVHINIRSSFLFKESVKNQDDILHHLISFKSQLKTLMKHTIQNLSQFSKSQQVEILTVVKHQQQVTSGELVPNKSILYMLLSEYINYNVDSDLYTDYLIPLIGILFSSLSFSTDDETPTLGSEFKSILFDWIFENTNWLLNTPPQIPEHVQDFINERSLVSNKSNGNDQLDAQDLELKPVKCLFVGRMMDYNYNFKTLICQFLFKLCIEDVNVFSQVCGPGNTLGFLAEKGLLGNLLNQHDHEEQQQQQEEEQ